MDFDAFYRDTSRRLARYAYGLTGDPVEAQDLVQEAYARAWQRSMIVTETGGAPQIFDAQGQVLYQAPLGGDWLDGKSLLVPMPDGTGRLARLSTETRKLTPYAKLLTDFGIRSCTSNSTRLACFRDDTGDQQVWKVG